MVIDIIVPLGDRIIHCKKQKWRSSRLLEIEDLWSYLKKHYRLGKADRDVLVEFVLRLKPMSKKDFQDFLEMTVHYNSAFMKFEQDENGYITPEK